MNQALFIFVVWTAFLFGVGIRFFDKAKKTKEFDATPKKTEADLEHELLSPEFIEWARDNDILGHPTNCAGCQPAFDYGHLTVNEWRAEVQHAKSALADEHQVNQYRAMNYVKGCHQTELYNHALKALMSYTSKE